MDGWDLVGAIARLQVQMASLKVGEPPERRYEPAGILAVTALTLDAHGVSGRDACGVEYADVHNQHHPRSKNIRGVNGISVGFRPHYAAMRERFGEHLADGIAGENILVDAERRLLAQGFPGGLLIETVTGEQVQLERLLAAEPCVEFSRYAMRLAPATIPDASVAETLAFLRGGMRGYYATAIGPAATIQLGDRLYRRR